MLLAAFIRIRELLKNKKRKNRRKHWWWVKEIYRTRAQCGNHQLMQDIKFEAVEETIRNFSRLSQNNFDHIYFLIEPRIRKMTHFREATSVQERFAVVLRFLN